MKVAYGFIRFCSLVSLIIFPRFISLFFVKLRDAFLSYRFAVLTKTKRRVTLRYPFYVKGHKYIHIGDNFVACPGFRIECWDKYGNIIHQPSIQIGDNVCFNYNCHIGAIDRIVIGNNVLVGSHVLITDHSHGKSDYNNLLIPPMKRNLYSKGPVIIDDNVWIGEGVCILPNVHIGANCIIGANAVVTSDIPSNCVVAGNPAVVIREVIQYLKNTYV